MEGKPENYLLDILMLTYNHERYIARAIESVLSQKCDFKFRLLIFDDNSIDNTSVICREFEAMYPTIIFYHRSYENLGLVRNYHKAFSLVKNKYISILEGDDYWTDRFKLSKQIGILEKDETIGLVHSSFIVTYPEGSTKKAHLGFNKFFLSGDIYDHYMSGRARICPLTVVFRTYLYYENVNYKYYLENNLWTIDSFLWPAILSKSKAGYLDEETGVYRIHKRAITQKADYLTLSKRCLDVIKVKEYYNNIRPVKDFDIDKFKLETFLEMLSLLANSNPDKEEVKAFRKKLDEINIGRFYEALIEMPIFVRFLFFKNRTKILLSIIKQKLYSLK